MITLTPDSKSAEATLCESSSLSSGTNKFKELSVCIGSAENWQCQRIDDAASELTDALWPLFLFVFSVGLLIPALLALLEKEWHALPDPVDPLIAPRLR